VKASILFPHTHAAPSLALRAYKQAKKLGANSAVFGFALANLVRLFLGYKSSSLKACIIHASHVLRYSQQFSLMHFFGQTIQKTT
jgi:hypothetical protein